MAKPEHLHILERGVAAWNRWRAEHPEIRPRLAGADLRGADLRGVDFRQVDLSYADLRGARLDGADLSGARLQGTRLEGASLEGARGASAGRPPARGDGDTGVRRLPQLPDPKSDDDGPLGRPPARGGGDTGVRQAPMPGLGFPAPDQDERSRPPDDRAVGTSEPLRPVLLTTVAPEAARPGTYFFVEAVFHVEGYEVVAGEGQRVEHGAARLALREGARLRLRLVPLDEEVFEVDETQAECVWTPPFQRIDFAARCSRGAEDGVYPLRLELWCEAVQIARLYVEIVIDAAAPRLPRRRPEVSRLPRSAFASYARKDRIRVAERVDSLRTVGIDVFLDCLDIRQADNWRQVLERELLSRDALLLFWSTAASQSQWVEREWTFAFERRGAEHILPNALEPPERCPPPARLAHLQFGSVLTELAEAWRRG